MKILGISCYYHDSAVAFLEDEHIRYALNEERITRVKQDSSFPKNALLEGLAQCNWDIRDIDLVAFYERPTLKLDRLKKQVLWDWPNSFDLYDKRLPNFIVDKMDITTPLRAMGFSGDVELFEHHYSHAASAFFTSPFERALALTLDGVGEWDCLAVYQGEGNRLEKLKSIRFPNSLGLFYSVFTSHLGFKVNSGEYKVMGLACYGKPTYLDTIMDNILLLHEDGSFSLNQKYFNFSDDKSHATPALGKLLEIPRRVPESKIDDQHFNLAASVQQALEKALTHTIGHLLREHPNDNLCMAGGVALNCTATTNLVRHFGMNLFIPPASGDAGGAIGAALAALTERKKNPVRLAPFDPYLGREFTEEEANEAIRSTGLPYSRQDDIAEAIATALYEGKIVSVHQSRDEWGPRALGNRSILANPTIKGMQDHLNAKIKFRESFRPFAPVCLEEHFNEYFDGLNMKDSPYMLYTFDVRRPDTIPAATHFNNTGRAQTVSKSQNPILHEIISKFAQKSGVPVLINTSFNLRGEPIVHTPADALKTFMRSGIDCLAIGNFFVEKAHA